MSTSISRVAPSRSGRSSGFAGSAGSAGMEEVRDRGCGKGGESASIPIPIVGRKMKKRSVEHKCEGCNKVGWFESFFFFFFPFLLYCFDFLFLFSSEKAI